MFIIFLILLFIIVFVFIFICERGQKQFNETNNESNKDNENKNSNHYEILNHFKDLLKIKSNIVRKPRLSFTYNEVIYLKNFEIFQKL